MNPRSESRKERRYSIEGVSGNVLYTSDIDVINISIDGAAIETTKRLDLNREYTFKIKYKDKFLNLRGRVVWAMLISKEKSGTKAFIPVYRAGVQFTDTLSEKANILMKFIEENRRKNIESRLGGIRFQIKDNKKIKIDYPHKYNVKKLSLSGMLVETEFPLDINSKYALEIFINENIINANGKIVNCEKVESKEPPTYNIGIEFIDLPYEDKEKLKLFLNSLDSSE